MIRIIAADMDGTLLDTKGNIPPETFELIRTLYEEFDVHFCPCSGRRIESLQAVFEPVADIIDVIAANGAEVYVAGERIVHETLDNQAMDAVGEWVNRFDYLHHTAGVRNTTYCYDADPDKYARFLELHGAWTHYTHGTPAPDEEIINGNVICSDREKIIEATAALNEKFGDVFTFSRTGFVAIDITPNGVDKASGLEAILAHYQAKPEEVIAYGDAMNDLPFMERAGHPVCVGNALHEVAEISERIIETNAEHGVQLDMQRLLDNLRGGGDGCIEYSIESDSLGLGSG